MHCDTILEQTVSTEIKITKFISSNPIEKLAQEKCNEIEFAVNAIVQLASVNSRLSGTFEPMAPTWSN